MTGISVASLLVPLAVLAGAPPSASPPPRPVETPTSTATPTPTPTPTPTLTLRAALGPGFASAKTPAADVAPTKTPSLQDYARRNRERPKEERIGSFSGPMTSVLLFSNLRVEVGESGYRVRALVRNSAAQRLHALFQIAGRRRDGSVARSTLPIVKIDPGQEIVVEGELPGEVDSESIVVFTLEAKEPAGTIELSADVKKREADKKEREALRSCLVYGHRLPVPLGRPSYSIEISVKNGCPATVQPSDLVFEVTIRDPLGTFVRRKEASFSETLRAGSSAKRSLLVDVPAGAGISVAPRSLP